MKNTIPDKNLSFDGLLAHLTEQGYANASQISEILTDFKNAVTLKEEDTVLFKEGMTGRSKLYDKHIENVAKAIYALQNNILEAAGKVSNIRLLIRPTVRSIDSSLDMSAIRIRCEKYDLVIQHTKETTHRFSQDGEWQHSIEISVISLYQGIATHTATLYLFMPEEHWPALEEATAQ